jgi:hypothetical protein
MDNYLKGFQKLPQEIRSIISSIDIANISRNIGRKINLTTEENNTLEQHLRFFLINVWTQPYSNTMDFLPMGLNGFKRELFYKDIYIKIFRPIVRKLNQAGLNDKDILFKNNDVTLTALTINEYPTSNVKIKDKVDEFIGLSVSLVEAQYKLDLIVNFSRKSFWGEYAELTVSFQSETEIIKFKEQLSIACKVGKFHAFSKHFSKWSLQKVSRKKILKKLVSH